MMAPRRRKKKVAQGNPAWVDRTLTKRWKAIEGIVGHGLMPREKKGVMVEYGCGAYGCVLPTHESNVVLKITTDDSEAEFAAAAMQLASETDMGFPPGMVGYYGVFDLDVSYSSRPVYLLWREEAHHVGAIVKQEAPKRWAYYNKEFGRDDVERFVFELQDFLLAAQEVQDVFDKVPERSRKMLLERLQHFRQDGSAGLWKGTPLDAVTGSADLIAQKLPQLAQLSAVIESSQMAFSVGTALGYYLDHGLLLADVHQGNIGEVGDYEDDDDWGFAITDPGNMVPLETRWLSIPIARVK